MSTLDSCVIQICSSHSFHIFDKIKIKLYEHLVIIM